MHALTITTEATTEATTEGIAPQHRRPSRLRRLVAGAVVVAAATTGTVALTDSRADAINPAQTTSGGVFNLLAYTNQSNSIANFWKWVYPYSTVPKVVQYDTSFQSSNCGWIDVNNSFYCPSVHTIYLSRPWNQTQLTKYGDYAAGGIAAHEFGHALARYLGVNRGDYRDEYFADCMAGIYTNFGYKTGRLVGYDYGEMYNWLYASGQSPSHGYGPNRAEWYKWGYVNYSTTGVNACKQVYNTTTSARSAGTAVSDLTVRGERVTEGTQRATKDQAARPTTVGGVTKPGTATVTSRVDRPSTAASPVSLMAKKNNG